MNKTLLYTLITGLMLTACGDDTSSNDVKKYDTIMHSAFGTAEQIEKAKNNKDSEIPDFFMLLENPAIDQLENKVKPKPIKPYNGMYKSFYEDFGVCSATLDKRESTLIIQKENKSDDVCSTMNVGSYNGYNYAVLTRNGKDAVETELYRGFFRGRMFSSYTNKGNSVVSISGLHIEGIRTPVEFINKQNYVITYQGIDNESCNMKRCNPFDVTVDFGTKKIKFKLFNGREQVIADIKGNQFVSSTGTVFGGFYGANASSLAFALTGEVGARFSKIPVILRYGLADKVSNSSNN